MTHVLKLSLLIFCIISITTDARERLKKEKHYVALSEIDRPINLGQRGKRFSAGHASYVNYNKNNHKKEYYTLFYGEDLPFFLFPNFELAISDSFSIKFDKFLPSIQYAFVNNIEVVDGIVKIKGPSIAFTAGISSFSWSNFDDQFSLQVSCGLLGKFPINSKVWLKSRIEIYAGYNSYSDRYNNTFTTSENSGSTIHSEIDVGLGLQISKKVSTIPVFNLGLTANTLTRSVSPTVEFQNTFKFNISNHFGIDIFGKLLDNYLENDNELVEGVAGLKLNFLW